MNAILSLDSSDPALIAQSIAAAAQNVMDEIKDEEDFELSDYKEAYLRLLSFLWCFQQGLFKPQKFGIKTDNQIDLWSKELHDSCLLPRTAPSVSPGDVSTPSNSTLCCLSLDIRGLTGILEK